VDANLSAATLIEIHDLRLIFYRAALMPVYVMQKTLWEVADVIEQVYTIAFTTNLQSDPEDREAAISRLSRGA
jgi:hypothetical protein